MTAVSPFAELELNSPSYPSDSGRNVSCSWTLVAPLGYSVALNFLDMDMRADPGGSCISDYVKLTDSIESPQSVLSLDGTTFCGELLPNYPGPSQLSSAGHRLTVNYRTDISNVARGRGFAAVASAVNPLCTSISYDHKYSDKTCDLTCAPYNPPPPIPEPHCYPVDMRVIILEADSTKPVSGAVVNVKTLSSGQKLESNPYWVEPPLIDVTRRTNLDGSIDQAVDETSTYKIKVMATGYFPHTVDVNITCEDVSYCGDCRPEAVIELEPLPLEPCSDVTLRMAVTDTDTNEAVTGAVVSITYKNNDQTKFAVEDALTDQVGHLTFIMAPVTEYTVFVSKAPYFKFNQTIDATCDVEDCDACTDLSLAALMAKPQCKDVKMTIHVNDKIKGDPIKDATVKVVIASSQLVVTPKDLITDETGSAVVDIPMDEEYEIFVNHDDFINQEKPVVVDCDELDCQACLNVEFFQLEPKKDDPICGKSGGHIILQVADSYTSDPVNAARVSATLLKNDYTRFEDIVITGAPMPTDKTGTFKIPVDYAGSYKVTIEHGLYHETEDRYVDVECPEEGTCSCEWELEHKMTQAHCDDTYLDVTVTDEITGRVIQNAAVNITLVAASQNIPKLVDELTDTNGVVKTDLVNINTGLFDMRVEKEGFYPKDTKKFVMVNPDNCGESNPQFTITLEPEHCQDQHVNIKVTDFVSKLPLADVPIALRLTNFANGATNTNVGGQLVTSKEGLVSPLLYADGKYTVTISSPPHRDYLSEQSGFTTNTTFDCSDISLPIELIPTVPDVCNPSMTLTIRDDFTLQPIPGARVNLTLTVLEENAVGGLTVLRVGENLETDENGEVIYSVTAYGNITAKVMGPSGLNRGGFHPNEGTTEVICDGLNCAACKPSLTVDLAEVVCPVNKVTVTVVDELTKEPLPETLVHFALVDTPETGSTFLALTPETTDMSGKAFFPLHHMGDYSIQVQRDGYDTTELSVDLNCNPEHCEACLPMYTVEVKKEYCEGVEFEFLLVNGDTNEVYSGADVTVDIVGTEGKLVNAATTTTNATGYANIPITRDGIYMFEITAPGYLPTKGRQVVEMACDPKKEPTGYRLMSSSASAEKENGEPNCDKDLTISRPPQPLHDLDKCSDGSTDKIKLSLAWETSSAGKPVDMDLFSFRVNSAQPNDTCLAYYCDEKYLCGCMEFGEDVKTGGLTGVETVSFCCDNPEVYMIFASDANDKGLGILDSDARITISQRSATREVIRLDAKTAEPGPDAHYWLAGCLTITDNAAQFTEVNKFSALDPSTSDPLFCYNLLNSLSKPAKKQPIPVSINVDDAISNLAIEGAVVRLSPLEGGTTVSEAVTGSSGLAHFVVDKPGTFEIITSATSFIPDRDILTVICIEDGFMVCSSQMTISMMPKIQPGNIQTLLNWDHNVDMDFFALSVAAADTSDVCKTYHSHSCKGSMAGSNSEDGLVAGEVITLSDTSSSAGNSYMLYASAPDKDLLAGSGARVTVSDGTQATTIILDVPTEKLVGAQYWIAGCMQLVGQSFQFYPVNDALESDPSLGSSPHRLHCHNLVQAKSVSSNIPQPFCDNTAIDIVVVDALNFAPVHGALITVSEINSAAVSIISGGTVTDAHGLARVPVSSNGRYQFEVAAPGYVIDSDQVNDSEKGSCKIQIPGYCCV